MTKNQFLKTIFNLNETFLKEKGFVPAKKTFEFIRADNNGYKKIAISCAKVGTRFYLTYGLLLRINKLEELVKPFSGVDEVHWKEGCSILTSAIYLKEDIHNKQYIIDKDEDITMVNEDFIHLMNEKGFVWLEKYNNNVSLLDQELNRDKSISPKYLNLLMVPLYGIAAAYLAHNPQLQEIIKQHKAIWEEKAKNDAEFKRNFERIERMAEYLMEK